MATAVSYPSVVSGKRTVRLRVIGGRVAIDDHVPATRADCKDGPRPCPHVRCEWHLWLLRGEAAAGRRSAGKTPPPSTLRPVWLDWPLPPSCGADLAEAAGARGELMSIEELSRVHDLRPSRVHEILATCTRKLKAAGADTRRLLPGDDDHE